MQQRRVRLGDVLDDYCPRERRITNHAVVAMIEDDVKQTRCTTCDAEHEYKHAKVPASRRKKPVAAAQPVPVPVPVEQADAPSEAAGEEMSEIPDTVDAPPPDTIAAVEAGAEPAPLEAAEPEEPTESPADDEWPVHRPLIRATLPRPEGQTPERKPPDFTIRQGGRFDTQRNGHKSRGNKQGRHAQGQSSGQSRFGNPRSGGHGSGQPTGHSQNRQGNRQGPSSHRGGRAGQGGGRPGQGRGPKRGR